MTEDYPREDGTWDERDIYEDDVFDDDDDEDWEDENMSEWEDKHGDSHIISDMGSNHIRNCIKMIEDRAKDTLNYPWGWRNEYLPFLNAELAKRKETATSFEL